MFYLRSLTGAVLLGVASVLGAPGYYQDCKSYYQTTYMKG
ncbi:hypothetical protein Ptr902_07235 [Pyrenophora tritici-repentis]|nr:hypothetical protein TUN205_11485 [Pyrenophora tritici-repentis]KAI0617052.1 hypothetical protein TUN199_10959 [Pyrenophora tritici-repentis]KAI2481440.1 hypothetical protein Ptr902_07235 [Pyrenophora tritici-repentis]